MSACPTCVSSNTTDHLTPHPQHPQWTLTADTEHIHVKNAKVTLPAPPPPPPPQYHHWYKGRLISWLMEATHQRKGAVHWWEKVAVIHECHLFIKISLYPTSSWTHLFFSDWHCDEEDHPTQGVCTGTQQESFVGKLFRFSSSVTSTALQNGLPAPTPVWNGSGLSSRSVKVISLCECVCFYRVCVWGGGGGALSGYVQGLTWTLLWNH